MIKAIVFDFAGVIINSPLRDWFAKNLPDIDRAKVDYLEITHKWDLGEIDWLTAESMIAKATGIPKNAVYKEIFGSVIFNTQLIELIYKLKKNYAIALFSNNLHELVLRLLTEHGHIELFDEIIVSSQHKLLKPQPEYFQKLLEILHVEKHEIVFTDDKQEFVNGANAFGIKTFLFTTIDQFKDNLMHSGVIV